MLYAYKLYGRKGLEEGQDILGVGSDLNGIAREIPVWKETFEQISEGGEELSQVDN